MMTSVEDNNLPTPVHKWRPPVIRTSSRLLGRRDDMENPVQQSKFESFRILEVEGIKKFQCNLCGRGLSSKQRILIHLNTVHNLSPVKRCKKKYLYDNSAPIPRRTFFRHKKLKKDFNLSIDDAGSETEETAELNVERSPIDEFESESELKNESDCENSTLNTNTTNSSISESDYESEPSSNSSSDSSSETDFTDTSEDEMSLVKNFETDNCNSLSVIDLEILCLLSYLLRHKITGAGGKDLLQLIKVLKPQSENLQNLSYQKIFEKVSTNEYKVFHYCNICSSIFEGNETNCATPGCNGKRYKGRDNADAKNPKCFFTLADIKVQLKNLFSRCELWKSVQKTKRETLENLNIDYEVQITDIVQGEMYRKLCEPGNFLNNKYAFSGIFNTDGVPLYSSSKVKLWPIFIAVNELDPMIRFSRQNLIVAGIWQGKNAPPFFQFMSSFGNEISELYKNGFEVHGINVKFGIFLGTLDLQAKSYVVNMSMHNGANGCLTCEEPGQSVKQGKGTARQYPYRTVEKRLPLRTSENIKQVCVEASKSHRVLGICGPSGLITMEWFDLVLGLVPDYMHGVLLGVTKTLLLKFFSPTNAGKVYFVGNKIKEISKRLKSIKPPDYIDRVPRDLEKNYQHFKASELQSWLLHYAIPCLHGYLPDIYLQHLAKLSEGVYLLNSDCITNADLQRAELLLDQFYRDFAQLYGPGSCGLNVHNIGRHLHMYVRMWGPLFAWSCFGFEDANANILSMCHGTQDVTRSILQKSDCEMFLYGLSLESNSENMDLVKYIQKMSNRFSKKWTGTIKTQNCAYAGAASDKVTPEYKELMKGLFTGIVDEQYMEVKRILIGNEKYYAKNYTKIHKKICYVVLLRDTRMMVTETFLLGRQSQTVYAVGNLLYIAPTCFLFSNEGHHVIEVLLSNEKIVCPVEIIAEKLVYMPIGNKYYISRVPNRFGHGVTK